VYLYHSFRSVIAFVALLPSRINDTNSVEAQKDALRCSAVLIFTFYCQNKKSQNGQMVWLSVTLTVFRRIRQTWYAGSGGLFVSILRGSIPINVSILVVKTSYYRIPSTMLQFLSGHIVNGFRHYALRSPLDDFDVKSYIISHRDRRFCKRISTLVWASTWNYRFCTSQLYIIHSNVQHLKWRT
jgi:hypothetical protein